MALVHVIRELRPTSSIRLNMPNLVNPGANNSYVRVCGNASA